MKIKPLLGHAKQDIKYYESNYIFDVFLYFPLICFYW